MFNINAFRKSVLNEAMQGKLTQQLPEDGDAIDLLQSITEEKQQLIRSGKIKKPKRLATITDDEIPFQIPNNWKWVRLGNIGLITSGGTPRKNKIEYWNNKYLPWITPKLLGFNQNHKLLHDTDQYISEKGLKESSAQFIEKGSIVFSSRAPIGHINIVDFDYSTNQGAKSITPLKINRTYLYYSLKERTDAIKKLGSGTTFKEISKTALSNSLVPVPPLAEQKRIVQKIDKCFKWADLIDQEQKLTQDFNDDMYKSLLQSAMQGQLTQQLPEDGDAADLLQSITEEKQRLYKAGKIKKPKQLATITDDEIPFKIPDNWQWVRLNNLSFIMSGRDIPKKYHSDQESKNTVPYITGAGNFNNFHVKTNTYLDKEYANVISKKDDLLITVKGTIGKLAFLPYDKAHIARQIISIRCFSGIKSSFIEILLELVKNNLSSKSKSIIPGIKQNDLKNLLVPLPPLNEQNRIVNKLDSLLSKIDKI